MQDAGKWSAESAFAWMVVIVLHAVVWRGLSRIDVVEGGDADASVRLRLTWIQREPPPILNAPEMTAPLLRSTSQAGSKSNPVSIRETDDLPSTTVRSILQPTRSLSAVFLEQGRRHAEQLVQAERLPMDPFASRNGGFQRPAPNTIRMKPQISPQDVVAAVGQYLFAPPGYEQDPCPQNARNIQKLLDGSDPKSMQYELEYEREYCRP